MKKYYLINENNDLKILFAFSEEAKAELESKYKGMILFEGESLQEVIIQLNEALIRRNKQY